MFITLVAWCLGTTLVMSMERPRPAKPLFNKLKDELHRSGHPHTPLRQFNISRSMVYGITPPSLSTIRSRVYIEGNWRHRNVTEPFYVCRSEDPGVQVVRNVVYLGRATFAMINPEPPQVRIMRTTDPLTYPYSISRSDFRYESATNNTRNFYQPFHTMGMDFHEVRIDSEGRISSPTLPEAFLRVLARRGIERVVPTVVTNPLVRSSWYENYAHFHMESIQYMMHGIIHGGALRSHGGLGMAAAAVRTLPNPADAVPWSAAAERHDVMRGNGGPDAHLFADAKAPDLGSQHGTGRGSLSTGPSLISSLRTLPRALESEVYGRTFTQTMTIGDTDLVPGTVVIPFHNPPHARETFNEFLWSFSSYFDSTAAFGDARPGGAGGSTPCVEEGDTRAYPWPLCGPSCVWRPPPLTISDSMPIITGQSTHVRNLTGRHPCEITPVIGLPTPRHAEMIRESLRVNNGVCTPSGAGAGAGAAPAASAASTPPLRVVPWDDSIHSHMLEQDPQVRPVRPGCPPVIHPMPIIHFRKVMRKASQLTNSSYEQVAELEAAALNASAAAAGVTPGAYAERLLMAATLRDSQAADSPETTFLPRDEHDLLPLTLVRSMVLAFPLRIREIGYFCLFDDPPTHESDWYPAASAYTSRVRPPADDAAYAEAAEAAPRATLSPRSLYLDSDKEGVTVIGAINALYEVSFRRIPPRLLPMPPVLWPEAFQRPEERPENLVVDYAKRPAALVPRSDDRTNQHYWVTRHMRSCARTPNASGSVWGGVVREAPHDATECWQRRGLQMQDRIVKAAAVAASNGILPPITWGDVGWLPLREQAILTHATDVMFSIPGAFDPSLAYLPRGVLRIVPVKHADWPHQSTGMWRIYRFHKSRRPLILVIGLPNCHLSNDYNCNISLPTRHFLGTFRKAFTGALRPQTMPRHPFLLRVHDAEACPAASAAAHVAELPLLQPKGIVNRSILDFETFELLGGDATMLWSPKLHEIHKPTGCKWFRFAVQHEGDVLWPPDGEVDLG